MQHLELVNNGRCRGRHTHTRRKKNKQTEKNLRGVHCPRLPSDCLTPVWFGRRSGRRKRRCLRRSEQCLHLCGYSNRFLHGLHLTSSCRHSSLALFFFVSYYFYFIFEGENRDSDARRSSPTSPVERSAPCPMKYPPAAERVCTRIKLSESSGAAHLRPGAAVSLLTPLDPLRQAKRLPIRVIKMLTAHTGHLLHPDYLQPLTSAPVSIEVGYRVFLFVCLLACLLD